MLSKETLIATSRFGLGPTRRDIEKAFPDPRDWLRRQIKTQQNTPDIFTVHPSSAAILNVIYENRGVKDQSVKKALRRIDRAGFHQALRARLTHQVQTDHPFAERLTRFWSNHFTVSRTRGSLGPAIPAYENEAIRPFIFSRFEDMLLSAIQHPCMLIYLDNISSVGPNSKHGLRRDKDLNENLAREIFELHTLGAQGGYSQKDVTNFAKILTGWTVNRKRKKVKGQTIHPGEFHFSYRRHEPGPQDVLGKTFYQSGQKQGIEALKEIARHPSTAKFIATKLVRHFVDDEPPAQDIDALARVFMKTGGDLAAVSHALINLDSAWKHNGSKVKSPEELVVSTLRALHLGGPVKLPKRVLLFPALKSMGQDIFRAPSPAGWPDQAKAWIAPESLMQRVEWARELSLQSASSSAKPIDIFEHTIAPVVSADVRRLIKGAPSREDALSLIFASPAFQRR